MTVEIERVTEVTQWAECEPLFARYVDWVIGELDARGVSTSPEQAAAVARGFAAERDTLLGPRGRVYLARVAGAPVGAVALKPVDGAAAEVKRLYVTDAARGLGVASSLMAEVISDARALEYASLRLETHRYMAAAIALYERLGFVEIAEFPGFEGGDYGLGAVTAFYELALVGGAPSA